MWIGSGSRLQNGPNGMHALLARGFKTNCCRGLGERRKCPRGGVHASGSGQFDREKASAMGVALADGCGGSSISRQLDPVKVSAIGRHLAGIVMVARASSSEEGVGL